jgi:hypothetical protein
MNRCLPRPSLSSYDDCVLILPLLLSLLAVGAVSSILLDMVLTGDVVPRRFCFPNCATQFVGAMTWLGPRLPTPNPLAWMKGPARTRERIQKLWGCGEREATTTPPLQLTLLQARLLFGSTQTNAFPFGKTGLTFGRLDYRTHTLSSGRPSAAGRPLA